MNSSSVDERGVALMHALLLVMLVTMTAGMMLSRTSLVVRGTLGERGEMHALQAAEAGLAKGRHALRRDPEFAGGKFRVGACDVDVTVRQLETGQWEITSRGVSYPVGRRGTPVQVSLVEGFGAEYWYRRSGSGPR